MTFLGQHSCPLSPVCYMYRIKESADQKKIRYHSQIPVLKEKHTLNVLMYETGFYNLYLEISKSELLLTELSVQNLLIDTSM